MSQGSSPMRIQNSSQFSAIFDSSPCSTTKHDHDAVMLAR